ncbi:MAG: AMP-binding acetyl-CoA synthetase [Deltaproteobacteria bacterium]|nr:MAG: AMP-binding acetyl-CoA synthetase [Deltaproteobacteria bacterium]
MGKQLLEYVYEHEQKRADKIYLTQPTQGGAVIDYTWKEVVDQARRMAAHLRAQNFEPGSRIAIISKNCAHFVIAELAIWMAGHVTVALYPTINADTAQYVMDHSESCLVFVGKLDEWHHIKPGVSEDIPHIAFPLAPEGHGYETWDDIMARTEPIADNPVPDPESLGILIYTSGSTGKPKGVMHAHGRMAAAAEGMVRELGFTDEDRALSYLPLAHVFERAYLECTSLISGAHIFFAESLDTFVADLKRAHPTVFISVPRLWLKFQLGVFQKMPKKKLDLYMKIPILSGIVKKKILTNLGLDAVRLAGSGSAPIPAELIAWYRSLGLKLLEGYAMSEDFAYSHLSTDEHNEPGYVGVPYAEVKVKISDEGEILIDSPGKMMGYYKLPELTAESFTEDGYFRTGDRGERKEPSGLLKITGRVKEIFKTSKGKYVAPAPIENIINNDPHVELSCVGGTGMPQPFAQLVLAEDLRPKMSDPSVKAEVEEALGNLLKEVNSQVEHHERLQFLAVANDEWSIANGMLTPTMKIRRNAIEDATKDQVEGWYEAGSKVIWA